MKNFLSIYIIMGSILGIYTCVNFLLSADDYPQLMWGGYFFGIIYTFIGLSGLDLIKNKKYSWYTIFLQLIQVIGFSMFGIKYKFCAGSLISIGYDLYSNSIYYIFKPIWIEFTVGKNIVNSFLYINIVPIIIAIMIFNLYDSRKGGNLET